MPANIVYGCILTLLSIVAAVSASQPCPPQQLQRLSPIDCADSFNYGRTVAIDGERLAIAQYSDAGGQVTLYRLDVGNQWIVDQILSAELPPEVTSDLGSGIAFLGDRLAVGNESLSTELQSAGAVSIYEPDAAGRWALTATITPDPLEPLGAFGSDLTWLSSEGRTLLAVGAPGLFGADLPGSVYLFEQTTQGQWREVLHIFEPGGGSPDAAFGAAMDAAEGHGSSILVVSAYVYLYQSGKNPAGSVYMYRFDELSDELLLEASFQAPDPYEGDEYGFSVSIGRVDNVPGITHRAAVGRRNEGPFGGDLNPGAVYIYVRRTDGTWYLESHLTPPVIQPNKCMFGSSVDFEPDGADRLLVGAQTNDQFGFQSGSGYLYVRDDATGSWRPVQGFYGHDVDALDSFGVTAALGNGASAHLAVFGAPGAECEGGPQEYIVGAAYSFDLDPADDAGACPDPVLVVQRTPDCDSGAGGTLAVRWFNATPGFGSRIAIAFARQTGSRVIPPGELCAGTVLGLGGQGLQLAYVGPAGLHGAETLEASVSRRVCGGYLQLLDMERCRVSNVVRVE